MGVSSTSQCQIQDFPKRGANPRGGGTNLLFDNNISENCIKMKETGLRGACVFLAPTLDPPLQGVANTKALWVEVGVAKSMTSMYGCVKICGVCV